MGTPVFPAALKVFSVYHDYTDIIWAISVNEIHDEVLSIETVLGTNPFFNTPYTTFSGAIQDLYNTKAPVNHSHAHASLKFLDADDHHLYVKVDGTRGFTGPVAGVAGSGNDLVPLHQLQALGYINSAQAQSIINSATANLVTGDFGGPPLYGPAPAAPTWSIRGGVASGCTDGGGRVAISLGPAFGRCVQAFTCTKIPAASGQPCPPYNWIEAQVTLVGVNLSQAILQFSHDYSWQPGMWVSLTWIAIGV
jgi:hypothetical protein